jgi:signal peptidase
VVDKQNSDGRIYFKTKGDFNRYVDDWSVSAEKVVGSFSARIPYIGIIIMKLREPAGTAFIVSLIIILIAYEAYSSHKKTKTEISGDESKIRTSRKS